MTASPTPIAPPGALDGLRGRRARERARRVGGQAPRRPRRRRDRRRTARRPPEPRRTDRSSTTSPGPSAACSGGTTTRRSAASCSTSHRPTTRRGSATLAAGADIVLEGEPPGSLADLGLDHDALRADHPELIWVSVTPFGRATSRANDPATDLTLLAGGGPVWNCGYDDHTIPPVRGGGNQALPHRQRVRGDERAHRAPPARRVGPRPVHRREHARGGERHHRERQLRLARRARTR